MSPIIAALLVSPILIRYSARYLALRARIKSIKDDNVVVTQYSSPPSIPAAFFGVIVDNKISFQDIVATLLDLHVKGIINITYDTGKDDYLITLVKAQDDLHPHESFLVEMLDRRPEQTMRAKDFKSNHYYADFNFILQKDLQRAGYYVLHKDMLNLKTSGEYYKKAFDRVIKKGLIKPWNWPGFILCIFYPWFAIIWMISSLVYYNRLGLFNYKTDKWEEWWPTVSGYYNYLKVVEAEKRQHALKQSGHLNITQHDPYLVAAQLQKHWEPYFIDGKEIGASSKEYQTLP